MFSHITIGSNDIARSKQFYDAVFATLGAEPGVHINPERLLYVHDGGRFIVTKPINGEAATPANGGTLGFGVSGPEQADAWHKAGVENGGASVENPPGERKASFGALYLAYLRDPDGNKLCALHRVVAD
jgi:catechol 2,3-dioxygenase-like lactoylglutathione lyase family enzyme